MGEVEPYKEGLAVVVLPLDKVFGGGSKLVVAGLHPLLGERAGVLDPLFADAAPTLLLRRVVFVGGPAFQDTARRDSLSELREVLLREVIVHLRLLLGVEVVEIAKELVEAVIRGQVFIQVAQMILAELSCRVPLG